MVILLKNKNLDDINIEIMPFNTEKGTEFKGVSEKVIIKAFLSKNQQFLTSKDLHISGDIFTDIDDILDQMNEYMEIDY